MKTSMAVRSDGEDFGESFAATSPTYTRFGAAGKKHEPLTEALIFTR
jgi:hypothetical protein